MPVPSEEYDNRFPFVWGFWSVHFAVVEGFTVLNFSLLAVICMQVLFTTYQHCQSAFSPGTYEILECICNYLLFVTSYDHKYFDLKECTISTSNQ